jgi:hypothetical protein
MNIKHIIKEIESTMLSSGLNHIEFMKEHNKKKLRNTFCDDCNSFSVYMIIKDELWNTIHVDNSELFLCPKCMEIRLGRKIVLDDLKICNVNYPYFFSEQFFVK